jgi:hypothetical protein
LGQVVNGAHKSARIVGREVFTFERQDEQLLRVPEDQRRAERLNVSHRILRYHVAGPP